MERVCFELRLRPERIEEYKLRHQQVWPEMLAALREAGWRNYSLFLAPDGRLIGYLETDDFPSAQEAMARTDVNRKWQAEMAPFFLQLDGETADTSFQRLEEVFHTD